MEQTMPSLKMGTLVALLVVGGLFMASRAGALPLQGAAAIGFAAQNADLRQDATYVCRRAWRCGSQGCGWRRSCYWTPGPFAQAYPYAYRSYWGWRGYPRYWARPHWRGRYWRDRR
jgi:hypothetical protein